jgi:2-oxoisovalerate dehydrogenase E1 component
MTTAVDSVGLKIEQRSKRAQELLRVYEVMQLSRLVDLKSLKLAKQNKGGTFQLSAGGHEMVGAVASQYLRRQFDWSCPYYRDQAMAIGVGSDLTELFGVFLGRETERQCCGRMMPYHYSDREQKIAIQSSVVGSQFLNAAGLAQSLQRQGGDEVVYVSGGDGSASQGDFAEALSYSALHRLPVIFVIQDNGWAISVSTREQVPGGSLFEAYRHRVGVEVHGVDGCNYDELATAFEAAAARGRAGEGPSLIVAQVPRLEAHSNSDNQGKYKSELQLETEKSRDPIPRFEALLLKEKVLTEAELERLKGELQQRVEEAAVAAEQIPFPKSSSAGEHLFAEWTPTNYQTCPLKGASERIVMVDAINQALTEEMERDEGVVVFGEDVAHGKGGVFGVTRGLTERFGNDRCFNTPLAEATIIGVAVGLSLDGVHKPVAEIQFADYLWPGFDQLVSEAASICYRSAGEFHVPIVVRMPVGGYIQGGPYHSQSIEGILANCPGLKIAIPSNAADAKGLLKAAIRDPNPVVFLEHKALYRQAKFCARPEPSKEYLIPFGKAQIVKEGHDLTIVGWGMTVVMANDLALKLAQEGIEVEVIDLRTIVPVDIETVVESVKKTGKLLIAHEGPRNAGFGAEIAAQVAEEAFEHLDGPIARVCSLDCPVPYSKPIENGVLVQPEDLEAAVRELYAY